MNLAYGWAFFNPVRKVYDNLAIVTWAVALLVWRYGHIEEKWSARLKASANEGTPLSSPWDGAEASE